MSLDKRKLDKVFEEAEMAFWGAVAEALPEIKTGDFSPSDSAKLEKAMKEAIKSWYEGNQPAGKSASEVIRNLENRINRLERKASENQLVYLNQDQSDYFDLDYFADKGDTYTVHTEALLRSNREYDREHEDFLTKNRGTLTLERTSRAYNYGPGWWEVIYIM